MEIFGVFAASTAALLAAGPAHAELSSLPFQNNTNLNVGPMVQLPTNSNSDLGNKNWCLGPTVVVLRLEKGDPWVYGALVNNIRRCPTAGSAARTTTA